MNKISVGVKKILFHHLLFVFVTAIATGPLDFLGNVIRAIIGGIAVLSYAFMLYWTGWNFGKLDSRKTVATKDSETPKYLHGEELNVRFARVVKASLVATIPTLVLLGLRIALLYFVEEIIAFTSVITAYRIAASSNIAYRFWVSPFNLFFQPFEYGITFIYFLPLIFMPIFIAFGYKVGLTRFTISENVLPKVLYKGKKKDK